MAREIPGGTLGGISIQRMVWPLAHMIASGNRDGWFEALLFLAILAGSFAFRYSRFFVQWLNGIRGRDWTRVSALIDVISVVEQTENSRYGERIVGYLATLT